MEHKYLFRLYIAAYLISSMQYSDARAVISIEVITDRPNNAMAVVKSGVRQFTLVRYNDDYVGFYIRCSTMIGEKMNPSLTLYKNNKIVTGVSTSMREHYFMELSKHDSLDGPRQDKIDKYSCQLSASALNVNRSRLLYVTESEVEIKFTSSTFAYTSDVGNTGYNGEIVNIFCEGYKWTYLWGYKRKVFIRQMDSSSVQAIDSQRQTRRVCGWYYFQYRLDNINIAHPRIEVVTSSLNLHLTPASFNGNSTLNFTCTSYPPRMMYWTIIRTSGNVLDVSHINPIFMTDTNVTVKEEVGRITLNISEGNPGTNGIKTVLCSTYDTYAYVVATSHLSSHEEKKDVDVGDVTSPGTTAVTTTPSTKTTEITTVTTIIPTKRMTSTRADLKTVGLETERTCGCDCEQKTQRMPHSKGLVTSTLTQVGSRSKIKRLHISEYGGEDELVIVPLLVTTTALLTLVILFLLAVILHFRYRNSKGELNPPKFDMTEDGIQVGTVMHDNPAYMGSSSEVSDDSDDEQCTYVNV